MQLVETHIAEEQKKPIRFQEYGVGIFKTIATKSGLKKGIKKKLFLSMEYLRLPQNIFLEVKKLSFLMQTTNLV